MGIAIANRKNRCDFGAPSTSMYLVSWLNIWQKKNPGVGARKNLVTTATRNDCEVTCQNLNDRGIAPQGVRDARDARDARDVRDALQAGPRSSESIQNF